MQATDKRNPWELYAGVEGWESASDELDSALEGGIRAAHLARADGASRSEAEAVVRGAVMPAMARHDAFGARDSEGMRYLERRIRKAFD